MRTQKFIGIHCTCEKSIVARKQGRVTCVLRDFQNKLVDEIHPYHLEKFHQLFLTQVPELYSFEQFTQLRNLLVKHINDEIHKTGQIEVLKNWKCGKNMDIHEKHEASIIQYVDNSASIEKQNGTNKVRNGKCVNRSIPMQY